MRNLSEIIYKIINQLLQIQAREVVSIAGEIHNSVQSTQALHEIPFLEEIAIAVRKKKSFPVLDISTEKLKQRFFTEIPKDCMEMNPTYYLHWMDRIDAFVEIGWKNITPQFSDELSMQQKLFQHSAEEIWHKILEQKKRMLFLNFPSPELAVMLDQPYDLLLKHYFSLLDCDYSHLKTYAEEIKKKYIGATLLLFTYDNTFTCKILPEQGSAFVGSLEKSPFLILPTGKVEFFLDRESLDGIFTAERCYYQKDYYEQVSICFERGEIKYLNFAQEKKGNFKLQNAMMNSKMQIRLSIGINAGCRSYTNYYSYDRCIDGNISFKMIDRDSEPILFSNKNVIINKK